MRSPQDWNFYCRLYFDDEPPLRTGAILLAFAAAMTALVTAHDLIATPACRFGTTFAANRRAALTALIITTFAGLAMLAGIVLVAARFDTYSLATVLAAAAETGTGSPLLGTAVVLLLAGALSKSGLVPQHLSHGRNGSNRF